MKVYAAIFFLFITVSHQTSLADEKISSARTPDEVIVGVWDQDVRQIYDENTGRPKGFKVVEFILPVAEVSEGKWVEVDHELDPKTWTVSFDGQNLGTCKSKTFERQPYKAYSNAHEVIGKIPHPDKAKKLSSTQLRSHRALVLVSAANYKDPDQWKPSKLTSEEEKSIKSAFRLRYPVAPNCLKEDVDNNSHPEKYSDADVKLKKVYRSNKKALLVQAQVEKWNCAPIYNDVFDDNWFAITPDGKVKFLRRRLSLIDAGDYINSGRSKLLFEDNSDGGDDDNARGYSLWDENFNMLVKRSRVLH